MQLKCAEIRDARSARCRVKAHRDYRGRMGLARDRKRPQRVINRLAHSRRVLSRQRKSADCGKHAQDRILSPPSTQLRISAFRRKER